MIEHERTGPLDMITWRISRAAMWLPLFIIVIIFYEVIMRYVFGSATTWVNETSLWVAGATYMFAGIYSMQQRSHIRIYILYDLAPLWLRRVFDVTSTICTVLFAAAIIWGGYNEALNKLMTWERFGTKFDPPIPATLKPLILITVALLAMQAISNLFFDWNKHQGEISQLKGVDGLLDDLADDHKAARPIGDNCKSTSDDQKG